ncbi:Phage integrase family protein [Roseimaritima multifibrata]|uniref:Phage integrase family protein n=1 Tax=Roseimaritima multifibrata TaxID=1930274 RepID=A0A517MH53_9BACT|nr:site-specific integrase [Roseimaritima multifibrata]QDS94214.1 Phage integrase family protein [Roseimaritima multifibrata]
MNRVIQIRPIAMCLTLAILGVVACPDQEWRAIFSLARYGGLRCPSEVLRLRWSDINWERGRFKIHATKTKRAGKGERGAPLFPELRVELEDLADIRQPGVDVPATDYVINRYRHTEQNLRSQLHRIADLAGVERWPKPFMCLRSTRRTELERSGRFANHVLNDWFGHSGAIAETHYLQTAEEDFDLAGDLLGIPLGDPSQRSQEPPREVAKRKKPGKTGF